MRYAFLILLLLSTVATAQDMQRSALISRTVWLPGHALEATDSLDLGEVQPRTIIAAVHAVVDTPLVHVDSISVTLDNGTRVCGWVWSDGYKSGDLLTVPASAWTRTALRRARVRIYNSSGNVAAGQFRIVLDTQTLN